MNALGIIAEYNPFHQGHKYLIDTASALTKADVCVSVMSGPFVQRGDFAYYDKWSRAAEAVKGGSNLVLELPAVFATASARFFASAGVRILAMANVKYLAFGSETGNVDELIEAEKIIADIEMNLGPDIKEEQRKGLSYPRARSNVIKTKGQIDERIFTLPNNILALEYIRAIREYGFDMEPVAIERKALGHKESASLIRDELKNSTKGSVISQMEEKYFDLIRSRILTLAGEELDYYDEGNEGLGNKLKKEIRDARNIEDLIERTKSKRYTYTRISRLLNGILLDIDPELRRSEITYIKPLAMDEKGSEYLKHIKNRGDDLIVVDDLAGFIRHKAKEAEKNTDDILGCLEIDVRSSDIYSLLKNEDLHGNSDYSRHPQLLRS